MVHAYWVTDNNGGLPGVASGSFTTGATGETLETFQTGLPAGLSTSVWADGQASGLSGSDPFSTPFLVNNPGPVYIDAGYGVPTLFLPIIGAAGLEHFTDTLDQAEGAGNYYLAGSVDLTGVTRVHPDQRRRRHLYALRDFRRPRLFHFRDDYF